VTYLVMQCGVACSVVVCKCGCGHMTSTEPLPSSGCVYRAVPTQWPSAGFTVPALS
jgi:hypothetical protein